MSSSLVIFCIQICLIQYACSQRVNGPAMVNNGLQYGQNNGLGGSLQGQTQLGGVVNGPGPGLGAMGANQAHGPYGQNMPNGQAFTGIPNQAFAGMPNQAISGARVPNKVNGGTGMPNQSYGSAGIPNTPYGGSGNGEVAVNGELPVSGMTSVTGHVPLTGKVAFSGNVPCGGVVTITGTCASCGHNAPYGQGQMPAYGNKPYGY